MSFELTGKLIEKFDTQDISDKFRKREFVVEKIENSNGFEFTDYIKFQLTQDKCSLIDGIDRGEDIKVSFNLRGRKWEKQGNVNYFTNLEAWRIEKISGQQQTSIPAAAEPSVDVPFPGEEDSTFSDDQETDDLPF